MNRFIKVFILPLILLVIGVKDVQAQVVINELSTNTSSDWVELYAYEDTDISGWILDDYNTSTNLEKFPDGTVIGPLTDAFLTIDVGDRLNKSGDVITLYNANSEKIDEIAYGDKGGVCLPSDNGSIGRVDNGNTIERFAIFTKDATNTGAQLDLCPTPSPTPTPTPTTGPTNTPTPAPTSTSTPTPKPTVTTKPTVTAKPTSTATPKNEENATAVTSPQAGQGENLVLGLREELNASVKNATSSENTKKFPFLAVVFIILGLGIMGFAVVVFLRSKKKGYNEDDGNETSGEGLERDSQESL